MDVKRFFEDRYARYGDSHETLDWSEAGQRERFRILSEVGDLRGRRVLDLGSGLGHFYEYLRERHADVVYTGYDFSERFVAHSQAKYPGALFEVHDVFRDAIPGDFDYVLCNGIHNLETGSNEADVARLLGKAWGAARIGVAFSMLSARAERRTPDRHYYDPLAMLSAALQLTPFVVLRHDYMPHDFTLYVYREARRGPLPERPLPSASPGAAEHSRSEV